MAEIVKKNKLKIPLDIETTVEPEIKPEDNFTPPKPRKNLADKFTEKKAEKKGKEEKETSASKTKASSAPKVSLADRAKKTLDFFNMEQTQRIMDAQASRAHRLACADRVLLNEDISLAVLRERTAEVLHTLRL